MLRKLRGEDIDWQAFRECRAPTAQCSKCDMQRDISHFTDAEWELARANRPATCIVCTDSVIGERRKRDLKTAKPIHLCAACKFSKVEDAFPRAQLEQPDATTKQICLKCMNAKKELQCDLCKEMKSTSDFQPQVLTLPARRCCRKCQPEMSRGTRGWFCCRGCQAILPLAAAGVREYRCPNCQSRGTRQTNMHACRRCSMKFVSTMKMQSQARERFCPKCRLSPQPA